MLGASSRRSCRTRRTQWLEGSHFAATALRLANRKDTRANVRIASRVVTRFCDAPCRLLPPWQVEPNPFDVCCTSRHHNAKRNFHVGPKVPQLFLRGPASRVTCGVYSMVVVAAPVSARQYRTRFSNAKNARGARDKEVPGCPYRLETTRRAWRLQDLHKTGLQTSRWNFPDSCNASPARYITLSLHRSLCDLSIARRGCISSQVLNFSPVICQWHQRTTSHRP